MNEYVRDGRQLAMADGELDREFDWSWTRDASAHELSAHGRAVQRRLDAPASTPARPSLWKRLRFALYRLRSGH